MPGVSSSGVPAPHAEAGALRIIHDLHGPLTVIRGLCATLARDEPRPDRRRALDLIDGETLRLAAGLEDLAAAGPGERPAVTRVDLAALTARAGERFAPAAALRGVRLTTRGAHAPVWIAGDGSMLERVVDNLVRNAIRHCAAEGSVGVALSSRGGRAVLRVRDDGPGVPPGDRERIFREGDRGSAPRGRGRGLGLAIAREIAEVHGGRLTLDPVGAGACFRLSVPLARGTDRGPLAA
jgi:signal transduction histidine kinase